MFLRPGFVVAVALALAACGSEGSEGSPDGGAIVSPDSGAGATDASALDATPARDSGAATPDAGTCAWTKVHTAAAGEPSGVEQVVLDPALRRLIAFGDALWTLDILSPASGWQRSAQAPPAMPGYSAALDAVRGRVILFGGCDGMGAFSDALTGVAPAPLASPEARCGHAVAMDADAERMIIFGGTGANGPLGDVWALDLSGMPVWREIRPASAGPGPRTRATAAYDRDARRLIVAGGRNANAPLADVWALTLGANPSWTQVTPSGSPPPAALALFRGAYDSAGKRLVFYAGSTSRGIDGTVWTLTLGAAPVWNGTIVTPHPPSLADADFPVAVDQTGRRLLVYAKTAPDEVWSLPLGCF